MGLSIPSGRASSPAGITGKARRDGSATECTPAMTGPRNNRSKGLCSGTLVPGTRSGYWGVLTLAEGPGQTRSSGSDPCTAQSRSARSGGGARPPPVPVEGPVTMPMRPRPPGQGQVAARNRKPRPAPSWDRAPERVAHVDIDAHHGDQWTSPEASTPPAAIPRKSPWPTARYSWPWGHPQPGAYPTATHRGERFARHQRGERHRHQHGASVASHTMPPARAHAQHRISQQSGVD